MVTPTKKREWKKNIIFGNTSWQILENLSEHELNDIQYNIIHIDCSKKVVYTCYNFSSLDYSCTRSPQSDFVSGDILPSLIQYQRSHSPSILYQGMHIYNTLQNTHAKNTSFERFYIAQCILSGNDGNVLKSMNL